MSALFNFGGPGWFNDVFEVDVILDDSTRKITLKGFVEQTVGLFGSHEKITGKLRLKSPPNRSVSHLGITLELESSLQYYESLNSVQHTYGAGGVVEVAPAGTVTGEVDVPFEFDLAKLVGTVYDSYDGERFDVRHSLLVTVKRPWYTFNVNKNLSIAIQTLSPALPNGESDVKQQLGVVPRTPLIEVDDCGGKVTFDYQRAVWNLGEAIEGNVVFSPLDAPLPICKLVLYKIEVADGENAEKTVKELDLVGGSSAAEPGPVPVEGKTVFCHFPLSEQDLTPTLVELNPTAAAATAATPDQTADEDATVNVHYYLRLLVEDGSGKKSWNTHEVILLRNRVSEGILPAGVV